MDFDPINLSLDVVQFLSTGAIGVYVWISNRDRNGHNERLSGIEDALDLAPKNVDIAGIYKRLDDLHGDIRELAGKLDALVKTHAMVLQHMIDGRK